MRIAEGSSPSVRILSSHSSEGVLATTSGNLKVPWAVPTVPAVRVGVRGSGCPHRDSGAVGAGETQRARGRGGGRVAGEARALPPLNSSLPRQYTRQSRLQVASVWPFLLVAKASPYSSVLWISACTHRDTPQHPRGRVREGLLRRRLRGRRHACAGPQAEPLSLAG